MGGVSDADGDDVESIPWLVQESTQVHRRRSRLLQLGCEGSYHEPAAD
jgi:hypothetical protein